MNKLFTLLLIVLATTSCIPLELTDDHDIHFIRRVEVNEGKGWIKEPDYKENEMKIAVGPKDIQIYEPGKFYESGEQSSFFFMRIGASDKYIFLMTREVPIGKAVLVDNIFYDDYFEITLDKEFAEEFGRYGFRIYF